MDLHGATALITGGARRLGRAIALALAHAGADVVINYRHDAVAAAATAGAAQAAGVRALALPADVSDPVQFEHLLRAAATEFPRLDLLVANAGAFRRTPLADATDADWADMLRDNLTAFFVPARALGPRMQQQGAGCIIALADTAGIRPWREYAPYSVAKSGVIALAQALAVELAPEVRVNAIAPGPILFPADGDAAAYQREIERTLLRRAGDPADVADAVLFLARNDYVTGVVLPVDGGRLLR
jgi:NAD(P)-dependent dehydrogenase (short-subunit alcohol dehydrogenase family)